MVIYVEAVNFNGSSIFLMMLIYYYYFGGNIEESKIFFSLKGLVEKRKDYGK